MKGRQPGLFTAGMMGNGVIGDPPVDTRHGPKTKSFGYQVLGFGSGGGPNTYNVRYLVIAGGAAGYNYYGPGGGGAGGYRTIACKSFEVEKCVTYPITVGSGGPNSPPYNPADNQPQRNGSNSVFSTITSAGGGTGGRYDGGHGLAGGSGGGGGSGGSSCPSKNNLGGAGNTPPVSPPQGNAGGLGGTYQGGAGGGGAGAVGTQGNQNPSVAAGAGGAGSTSNISGSCVQRAGGGGGGQYGPDGGAPVEQVAAEHIIPQEVLTQAAVAEEPQELPQVDSHQVLEDQV